MTAHPTRATLLAAATTLLAPAALSAHDGHAGHHGLLTSLAQPFASPDHLVGALVVLSAVLLGAVGLVRLRCRSRVPEQMDPLSDRK